MFTDLMFTLSPRFVFIEEPFSSILKMLRFSVSVILPCFTSLTYRVENETLRSCDQMLCVAPWISRLFC